MVQVYPQALDEQVDTAFGGTVQEVPHAPQWAVDVTRFVSQPSAAMPLQSPKPARHVYPHAPAAHVAVALGGIVHEAPHVPQLFTSVGSVRQLPLHAVIPVGHTVMHAPAMHAVPLAHALLHDPQWVLVSSADSQPLLATPSQSAKPAAHEMTRHALA